MRRSWTRKQPWSRKNCLHCKNEGNATSDLFPVYSFVPIFTEIEVVLDIFAGLPNPAWTITNDTAEFETLKAALTGAKSSSIPVQLGYRGFLVTTKFTDGTVVYRTYGQGGQPGTTLEMVLLNSNPGTLSSDVMAIAAAGINGLVRSLNPFLCLKTQTLSK